MFKIGDLIVPKRDTPGKGFINPYEPLTAPPDWGYAKRGDLYVYVGQMTIVHGEGYKNICILFNIKDLKIVHLYENEIEACLTSAIL